MKIGLPRQNSGGETRVALIPAVVKKLVALGAEVFIESGAGNESHHDDHSYEQAGATIVRSAADELWPIADVIVAIQPMEPAQAARMREGAIVMGMLAPLKQIALIKTLAEKKVTSFSMDFIPRISRAQPMDVLTSQANIAGYIGVIRAAEACPKMFPMMMTAAGTIPPARVFVIGAGVAGLQAIATAKRLGAVVDAFDVRSVVKEQIQSLGARFVELPLGTSDAETKGGYAKELTEEQKKQQQELMAKYVINADAVITTAALFGKAPPLLIPESVVREKRAGTVIVDLAADADAGRGNCASTQPGKRITTPNGVVIDGTLNMPGLVPVDASQTFANNMLAFLREIIHEKQLRLNFEDEIQKGAAITHDGRIVNEMVAKACGITGGN